MNSPRATLKKNHTRAVSHVHYPQPSFSSAYNLCLPLDALKEKSPPLGSTYALLHARYALVGK